MKVLGQNRIDRKTFVGNLVKVSASSNWGQVLKSSLLGNWPSTVLPRSFSPLNASDMLCPFRAIYVHTFTRGTTRTRARPERGCRPEHERDGRDRPVHRDSVRHSGDGWAAMPACVGGGSGAFPARRIS